MKLSIELKEKIDGLVKKGEENGFLTYKEINSIFTNDIIWSPYLEELFAQLATKGIEIREEEEKIKTKPLNAMSLYIRDIAKIPLLSPEEERELSKKIEECRIAFVKMAKKIEIPLRKLKEHFQRNDVPKETKDGFKKIDFEAYTARRKMIESNLRLVVMIAKRYDGYSNMPLLDLISEGNIGLIRAVDKFDYKEGYRFSTYATWWIRHNILTAIATESRVIKIPQYLFETINRSIKVKVELEEKLGRSPKMEEIAQKMGLAINRLIEIMNASSDIVSLETAIGDDESTLLAEIIEDKRSPSPADMVFLQILQDNILSILDKLPKREKDVISLRFGLFGNLPHTLDEVAKKLNLSKEGVRQIEIRVLSKLRKRKVIRELKEDFIPT